MRSDWTEELEQSTSGEKENQGQRKTGQEGSQVLRIE